MSQSSGFWVTPADRRHPDDLYTPYSQSAAGYGCFCRVEVLDERVSLVFVTAEEADSYIVRAAHKYKVRGGRGGTREGA